MTTSAARTIDRKNGFTLLEIIIVLAIAAIVMGGAVGLMVLSSDERELGKASGEIELLAKQARATAIVKQTPYAVEFREGVARVLPLALAGMDERRTAGGRRIGGVDEEENPAVSAEFRLASDMSLAVRRWNSEEWLPARKSAVHVWRFDPDGITEPLGVRIATQQSWIETTFHPLTATIQDTRAEFR